MRLLLCLAERPGEVVSIEELLAKVWTDVAVSSDSVYQGVASLRRVLGDDPRQPTYIATVSRLGYRMVATVAPWEESSQTLVDGHATVTAQHPSDAPAPSSRRKMGFMLLAAGLLCIALVAAFVFRGQIAKGTHSAVVDLPQKSIAVLPFLDLTEGMKEEEFADGMTEELIDRLSKVSGVHVPSATSSFYFKGKQVPLPDIARSLKVAYVLDGSVRKAGTRVRIAARLVRADDGYVLWSGSYDRPFGDLLMVQDDIAGEVTKALSASIEARPGSGQSAR